MSLLKKYFAIGYLTFASRILGLVRDIIVAKMFDTSTSTDAFFAAFKIPNLFRNILSEGVLSQIFVPIIINYKEHCSVGDLKNLIRNILGLFMLFIVVIVVIGIILSHWIVLITVPGFCKDVYKFHLTIKILKITFPYIIFISLSALISSILNAYNEFIISSLYPIVFNVSMIICLSFVATLNDPSIIMLAWSIFISGILQLFYQVFALKKIKMVVFPSFRMCTPDILNIAKLIGPAVIGSSIRQISFTLNTILASLCSDGYISCMYYVDRFIEFPVGMFGVTISTIILPVLSKHYSNKSYNDYSNVLDCGMRICILFSLPCSIILCITSNIIIELLLQHGRFNAQNVLVTQQVLSIYSVGLIGFTLTKVLLQGFYSLKDTKTPVSITMLTLVLSQMMSLIFVWLFKYIGLAISIGCSAYINVLLLYNKLKKLNVFKPKPGWAFFFIKLMISGIIMIVTLFTLVLLMPYIVSEQDRILERAIYMILVCIVSCISYFLSLFFAGINIRNISNMLFK